MLAEIPNGQPVIVQKDWAAVLPASLSPRSIPSAPRPLARSLGPSARRLKTTGVFHGAQSDNNGHANLGRDRCIDIDLQVRQDLQRNQQAVPDCRQALGTGPILPPAANGEYGNM